MRNKDLERQITQSLSDKIKVEAELNQCKIELKEARGYQLTEEVPEEYKRQWMTMVKNSSKPLNKQQQQKLQQHHFKKKNDESYRIECDRERNSIFLATDRDLNGSLDLEEWKQYCKKHREMLSRKCGIDMPGLSDQDIETHWKINQFEQKDGITRLDFKQKAIFDTVLTLELMKQPQNKSPVKTEKSVRDKTAAK